MPFFIVRNDIVNMQVDAIVNTANPNPEIGTGVDTAIHYAAGPELLHARKKIGPLSVGDAALTPAYKLNAKYVVHAVGPIWQGGESGEKQMLISAFRRSLELAYEAGCSSIAFPLMATGNYGFPNHLALQIAIDVFTEFLNAYEMDIYLVVFNKEAFEISRTLIDSVSDFIDDNYVREQTLREYGHYCSESRVSEDDLEYKRRSAELSPVDRWCSYAKKREPRETWSSSCNDEEALAADDEETQEDKLLGSRIVLGCNPGNLTSVPQSESRPQRLWGDEDACFSMLGTNLRLPSAKKAWQHILNDGLDAGFSETLISMILASGESFSAVYKRANVTKQLFSKIRNNKNYSPSKQTALAFALALKMNMEETQSFIARAGYVLTHSSRFDLVVEFFIRNKKYNIIEINQVLFELDLPLIGA